MNVISAWDVYWVMQLDSIGSATFWMPVTAMVVAAFIVGISEGMAAWDHKTHRLRGWVKPFLAVMALSMVASVLTPSSKTAAAMIVLPAIANNETIHKEAGDLYAMAKQALADAVGHEEPAK